MRVEQDIVLKMERDGHFIAAAPAIVARVVNSAIPDLAVAVKIAIEGRISALAELTEQGIAVQIDNIAVLESQYTIAGSDSEGRYGGGDISLLVAPYVAQLIDKMTGHGFLDFRSGDEDQILTFTGGPDFQQIFRRPAPSARMHSLRFVDSLVMHRNDPPFGVELDFDVIGLRRSGDMIANAMPHWSDKDNHPALYLRGATVTVEVEIEVAAGTRFKLFGIDPGRFDGQKGFLGGGPMYLSFESGEIIASGGRELLTLHAKQALPADRVSQFVASLRWNIYLPESGVWGRVEQPRPGRQSGPHRIYATYAKPIAQLSNGLDNPVTESRIRLLTLFLGGDKGFATGRNATDDHRIAHQIQNSVNNYVDVSQTDARSRQPISTLSRNSFGPGIGQMQHKPEWLWHLMDPGTIARGHCAEATFLMESMLRMLGIDADQTHVYPRSTLAGDLASGNNFSQQGAGSRAQDGHGAEVRTCPDQVKDDEALAFNFNCLTTSGHLNSGEGCVMVHDTLYTGLISHSVTGKDGRKATHELLLLLEKQYGDLDHKDRLTNFQVWIKTDGKGGEPKLCPHLESGQRLPGFPVPKN